MSEELINDVNRCIRDMDIIDKRMVTAKCVFDEEFLGFKGHFENNPILPGVCKIFTAVEIVKRWKSEEDLNLHEINSAKFFMPVKPNEELTFNCFDNESSECFFVKITILKGEDKVSELKLKF